MPDALAVLRKQMRAVQIAALRQGRAAVIAIEGYDAAGKGGVIRELSYALDPRGFCVYPIGAPTLIEAFRPFLWRFWSRLPAPGQLVIFDRSWYGRVLVERVEQGLSDQAYVSAFDAIDTFEATLEDQDIRLIKCFLDIPAEIQRERLRRRARIPEKRWKLTLDDLNAWEHRAAYEHAVVVMLSRAQRVPWVRVDASQKSDAHEAVLAAIIDRLSDWLEPSDHAFQPGVEERLGELDP